MEPSGCANAEASGSVSRLVPGLRAGDRAAVAALWERYFQPLVRVAATRMNAARCRKVDPEDMAQEIILEFARLVEGADGERRFPRLESRKNLWGILVCLTVRAAFEHNKVEERHAEVLGGESVLGDAGAAGFAGREPAPEFDAAVNDLLAQLEDPEDREHGERLQTIARMVMAGHTQAEIAEKLDCCEKTVGEKVKLIRKIWRRRAGIGEEAN